ncbi:MAG: histidine phosphatase family protein [Bacteroidetes bacterium]|nr:histidine phosphatase family protein [Bacteroidota bacterium]
MKELILIRHAKSDWGNEYLKDIDRHLNDRGYGDAYLLSNWYFKSHGIPDLILSSTATRALNTALIFARTFDFNMNDFILEKNMYESTAAKLLSIIKKQNDTKKKIMLFSHNPGITNLSNDLCKDVFFDNLPTCAIVSLKFETNSWKDITEKNSKLNYHQFPKDHKNSN